MKTLRIIPIVFIIGFLFISCPITVPLPLVGPNAVHGAMLVQFGHYVYHIGGEGDFGKQVYRISVSEIQEGRALSWIPTSELPQSRAYGAAIVAGRRIYVIGGEDDAGRSTATIYRAYIYDDGSIGSWNTFGYPLPYPLSRMGYTAYDGRIFLTGGKTSTGTISDIILQGRVSPTTYMGAWYESPQKLSSSSALNTATIIGRENDTPLLVVSGGVGSSGILSSVDMFEIADFGKLTKTNHTITMPQGAISPIVFSDNEGIVFLTENTKYLYSNDSWSSTPSSMSARGGIGSFMAADQLWLPSALEASQPFQFSLYQNTVRPPVPFIFPGTGFVSKNEAIVAHTMYGSEVLSSSDESSWSPLSPIEQTQKLYFKTEGQHLNSFHASSSYTVLQLGFLINLSGYLPIKEEGNEEFVTIEQGTSSRWYGIVVTDNSDIELRLKDSPEYNATVKLSLRESGYYNEVLDTQGDPIRAISSSPISLSLQSGQYYLRIDVESGTTYAVQLRRR